MRNPLSQRFLTIGVLTFLLGIVYPVSGEGAQTPSGEQTNTEVTLQVVKFAQFTDSLKKLKGKIVVVDVWGEF
jgi:hypothetical protein